MKVLFKKFYIHIVPLIFALVILFCCIACPIASAAWYNDTAYEYMQSDLAQLVVHSGVYIAADAAGAAIGTVCLPGVGTVSGAVLANCGASLLNLGIDKFMAWLAENADIVSEEDYIDSLPSVIVSGDYYAYYYPTNFSLYYCGGLFGAISTRSITSGLGSVEFTGYHSENSSVFDSSSSVECWFRSSSLTLPSGTYRIYPVYGYYGTSKSSESAAKSNAVESYSFFLAWGDTYKRVNSSGYLQFTLSDAETNRVRIGCCDIDSRYGTYHYQSMGVYIVCTKLGSNSVDNFHNSYDRPVGLFQLINNFNNSNNFVDDSSVANYYISPISIDSGLDVGLDVSFDSLLDLALYDESTKIFTEPVTGNQYQTSGWTYDYTTRTYTLDLNSGTFFIGDYDIDTIDLTYGDDELTITYYSNGSVVAIDEYAYVIVSQSECVVNGHTNSLVDYQAPTCGSTGYSDYVCSVCGNEYRETIAATGAHSYTLTDYLAETCGTSGYRTYSCSVCGTEYTVNYRATGNHSYEYSVYQEPTCTAEGLGLYTCSVCGNQYTESIPANGHSYAYSVLQEPTCTVDGIGIYFCTDCGNSYTESIAATGHDWVSRGTTSTSYFLPDDVLCPDCGSDLFTYDYNSVSHIYDLTCSDCGSEWSVDADISYGTTTYACSICGETNYVTSDSSDSSGLFGAIASFISSGISWIIDKFTSLIESISGLIDTFNEYVATLSSTSGSFPAFLAGVVAAIPDELTVILWFAVIAFVVAAVWKKFFM